MKYIIIPMILFAIIVSWFHSCNFNNYMKKRELRRQEIQKMETFYQQKYCGQTVYDMPCDK